MTKGERLRKLREKRKMSMEDVAKQLNISRQAVDKYEKGTVTNIPTDKIEQLAKLYLTTPAYIMGWDDHLEKKEICFDDFFPLHYCTNLSAGSFDELIDLECDANVYVPIKFQLRKNYLMAMQINGTSMNNLFPDGSIIVIDRGIEKEDIKDGTVVVAWKDNSATVKRFYESNGIISLCPDSKDKTHKPIIFDSNEEPVKIIGKVIWHMNPDDINKSY